MMFVFMLYIHFQQNVLVFLTVYARLAVVFYLLPILGERVLSNLLLKNTLISLTIIGLWPCFEPILSKEQGILIVVVKECVVGLLLALTLCIPFWVAVTLGEILDNQRGATLSDSIDPINGPQSSVLSGFISFTFGAMFFASGGMIQLLDMLRLSYKLWPQGSSVKSIHWDYAGQCLQIMMQTSLLLAAPVMVVMMVAEVLLGLFARYCPQLNPFSLSLTLKSVIAFIIFVLYGFPAMIEKNLHLFSLDSVQAFIFSGA